MDRKQKIETETKIAEAKIREAIAMLEARTGITVETIAINRRAIKPGKEFLTVEFKTRG